MSGLLYRIGGLLSLLIAANALVVLFHAQRVPPVHAASGFEVAIALLVVVTGLPGIALLISGATLFAYYEWPPTPPFGD